MDFTIEQKLSVILLLGLKKNVTIEEWVKKFQLSAAPYFPKKKYQLYTLGK